MSYQEVLWQDILGGQVKSIVFVSDVYVCMCMCMCVCVCTCNTHTYTHAYICAYMFYTKSSGDKHIWTLLHFSPTHHTDD